MPKPWLVQLEKSASQLDSTAIAQLTQVPQEHFLIAKESEDHVNDFNFDRILTLAQEAISL